MIPEEIVIDIIDLIVGGSLIIQNASINCLAVRCDLCPLNSGGTCMVEKSSEEKRLLEKVSVVLPEYFI